MSYRRAIRVFGYTSQERFNWRSRLSVFTAYAQGVVHRDIKPSNLLLLSDGRLHMNDFGLARMLEQPGMTVSGEFVGSPMYISPEQIAVGRAPLDHRTDIYSLGATLYQMLTLEPPFPGERRDRLYYHYIPLFVGHTGTVHDTSGKKHVVAAVSR